MAKSTRLVLHGASSMVIETRSMMIRISSMVISRR